MWQSMCKSIRELPCTLWVVFVENILLWELYIWCVTHHIPNSHTTLSYTPRRTTHHHATILLAHQTQFSHSQNLQCEPLWISPPYKKRGFSPVLFLSCLYVPLNPLATLQVALMKLFSLHICKVHQCDSIYELCIYFYFQFDYFSAGNVFCTVVVK